MKTLRPHQSLAIDLLRDSLRTGHKRPVLCAPVGFGKTLVAASIVKMARAKGNRVLFVVDALSLIDQTIEAFWAEGIREIGVIQAGHEMTDWSRPVQIASVQTLRRRGMPRTDMVIVDECHALSKWLLDVMAKPEWAKVPFIGLSATPWTRGLGNHYDDLLIPATMAELIETINPDTGRPYLSPYRVFAPYNPDLSKIKTVAGEYHEGQLSDHMNDDGLVADIVETWKEKGEMQPTLAFCVDRAHAAAIQARFQASGIGWGYIDAFTEIDDRKAIRRQIDRREIYGVSSVGTMIKGVDWAIGCIIDAGPTKSKMRHVQKIGRGLRINEGIGDLILLDHAGNCLRLGFPCGIQQQELCTKKKGEKDDAEAEPKPEALPKPCPKCNFLKPPKVRECPACKFVPEVQSDIQERDGELVEVKPRAKKEKEEKYTAQQKEKFFAECMGYAESKGKSQSTALAIFKSKFKHWPAKKAGIAPLEPTSETLSWIRSRNIAYAKSQQKASLR